MQLLKHAELLDYRQWRVVGKHYAAGANAQARGSSSHVRDQDRRRRAGQPQHVVVLGHPITLIANPFGELGEPRGMPEGLTQRRTTRHRGVVKNGETELSADFTPN